MPLLSKLEGLHGLGHCIFELLFRYLKHVNHLKLTIGSLVLGLPPRLHFLPSTHAANT